MNQLSTRLPGILKTLGMIMVVLVANHTGSIITGLTIGLLLLVLGEALEARAKLAREGVLVDEREKWIMVNSGYTAYMTYTITGGLLVALSLILDELGYLTITQHMETALRTVALSVFAMIIVAYLASLYYSRAGKGGRHER